MTMADTDKAALRGPSYVAIDSTMFSDAEHFGRELERLYGGKNILDVLSPARDSAGAVERGRFDAGPRFPFMPVYCIKKSGAKADKPKDGVMIMMPSGHNGFGKDRFWKTYDPARKNWGYPGWDTHGRHTAAEASSRAMEGFVLSPMVQMLIDPAYPHGRAEILTDPTDLMRYYETHKDVYTAELVFVSSHGYFGGFMRGDNIKGDNGASPVQARSKYFCHADDWLLGRALKTEFGFWGPIWVILAQCSTCNEATWPDWVRLFVKSSPQVRGVLAYRDLSPEPGAASKVFTEFFKLVKTTNMVDAWARANGKRFWSAVVHQDARDDRIQGWQKLLANPVTGSSYLGCSHRDPTLKPISLADLPVSVKLEHQFPGKPEWKAIEPHNLDHPVGHVFSGHLYRMTVSLDAAAAGESIQNAVVDRMLQDHRWGDWPV